MVEIKQYIAKFEEAETSELIEEGVRKFLDNHAEWIQATDYRYGRESGERIFGEAFVVFTNCLYKSESQNECIAEYISSQIREYEARVDCQFANLYSLFFNMGLIWHKIGKLYDDNAIEEFKKSIYYMLALSNNTSYTLLRRVS